MADQLELIGRDGLPNYFDRQRFGSLGESGEFMAQAWCERRHERTLWLALADPMAADRPADRTEKQLLRDRWGQWEWLAAKLPRSPRRDAAAWLAGHPDDFRRAVVAIPAAQRRLHIEAFQSHLWNRLLAALLQEVCPSEQLLNRAVAGQTMPFYRALDDAQRSRLATARLPLPSSRTRLEAGPLAVLVESTLASMNLRLRDLEIRYPRDSFFSKGDRAATFLPQQLAHQADDDDLYPGRRKFLLQFDLPRGCYATILIGRLTE
jgi:tRNA pseudouridine13 synthase